VLEHALLVDDPSFGELVLVRHAQQGLNNLNDPSRPKAGDAPLSERGERQAEAAADRLGAERVDRVYVSTLRRARQTADAIAALHGVEPIVDVRLREVEVFRGIPAGSTVTETLGPNAMADVRTRFTATRTWDAFPLTETIDELHERLGAAIGEITAGITAGERVVVVSHGGAINVMLHQVLQTPAHMLFFPNHASISRLGVSDGRIGVRSMNETDHLRLAPEAGLTY
jgi:probable phosphoglycerate mutase